MTKKKLKTFELTDEGEIYAVTFNFKTSVDDFTEEHKKWYKTLSENVRTEYYIVDKDGNYILLNKDNL